MTKVTSPQLEPRTLFGHSSVEMAGFCLGGRHQHTAVGTPGTPVLSLTDFNHKAFVERPAVDQALPSKPELSSTPSCSICSGLCVQTENTQNV